MLLVCHQPTLTAIALSLFLPCCTAVAAIQRSPDYPAYATVEGLPLKIERYRGTPYYFLDNGELTFVVAVGPRDNHALDLYWGSKKDQRTADVVVNGKTSRVAAGGYDGFRWVRVPVPRGESADKYEVTVKAAGKKAAFIAAVRLVDKSVSLETPFTRSSKNRHVTFKTPQLQDGWLAVGSFEDAPPLERNGLQARRALTQSHKFLIGWLAKADPESGLIPENLSRGIDRWNGRNNAADNYAFMVLTAALTDRDLFNGKILDMLRAEERLTSRVDRLGDSYIFSKRGFEYEKVDIDRLIFDNSEYVKDGLMPLTEWLGHSPWSVRMSGIIDDIWKHAPVETAKGNIPSTNAEVNGEMMQLTSRYFWMTGQQRYLEYAIRIADWYLLGDRHPTRNSESLRLRDHGCELISGLTEVYFACSYADKKKAREYKEPLYAILDCILESGIDENGMMVNAINPQTGTVTRGGLSDNWGYNYNGFYTVYLVDGVEKYRQAVRRVLGNLDRYKGYAWEGRSHDGYADSIESAINLVNREPSEVASKWIDSQMRIMLAMQQDDGIVAGWHGDGNFARTAIMYALGKQQGVTLQPWRKDVCLGATCEDGTLKLLVTADRPWQGELIFDAPRHKTVMRMPQDYPRINQFPEWFTARDQAKYKVTVQGKTQAEIGGRQLIKGLPLELDASNKSVRMVVEMSK